MKSADQREREAIEEARQQLNAGWTVDEVLCVLADAHLTITDLRAQEAS